MASTMPSALDQENMLRVPGSARGKAFSRLGLNVSSKKFVSATPQKQLLFPGKPAPAITGRTFGDISNRLTDRGALTPAAKGVVKLQHKQRASVQTKTKISVPKPISEDVYRDFFPVITEVEDYSDVLPSHLLLDSSAVRQLTQAWSVLQQPALPCRHLPPTPPPTPLLQLETTCWPSLQDGAVPALQEVTEALDLPPFPADW